MTQKGIHLKDILTSPLLADRVKGEGLDGLRQLADEQAAMAIRGKEKVSVIRILHKSGDTTIDISLSNVHELQSALLAIGYKKKGILNRIKDWWWMK